MTWDRYQRTRPIDLVISELATDVPAGNTLTPVLPCLSCFKFIRCCTVLVSSADLHGPSSFCRSRPLFELFEFGIVKRRLTIMSFLLRVYSDFHGSKPITAPHPAGKGSSVFARVTWSRLLPTTSSGSGALAPLPEGSVFDPGHYSWWWG